MAELGITIDSRGVFCGKFFEENADVWSDDESVD